jgi:hypothetical protein
LPYRSRGFDDREREAQGEWARDDTRNGLGGYYARDDGWSGGGARDDYTRDPRWAPQPVSHSGRGPKNYRRSDERLLEEINERLTDDHAVDATHIEVKVEDGLVTLTGFVATRREKREAEDCALAVRGVHDVMNALRVARGDHEVAVGKGSE